LDLMLVAEGLPNDAFERARALRQPVLSLQDPDVSLRALTPQEYERDIAPIDLDIAVDGVILADRYGYLGQRLALVRQRLVEAGLERNPDLSWRWKQWPRRKDWAVGWEGVRL
jgi:hypothetical protein